MPQSEPKHVQRRLKTHGLLSTSWGDIFGFVDASKNSVTLTADHVAELHRKLKEMRHNVYPCLSLVAATVEIARVKRMTPRWPSILSEQPQKIAEEVQTFASELDPALTPPPQL